MSKLKCLCAWILLISLWTFLGVRVGQDYEVKTAFSQYKRFDFAGASRIKKGPSGSDNPFLMKRIHEAVENTLVEKGYQRSSKGNVDFLVAYHWSTVARVEVDYTGDGWFGHRYPGDSAFETTVQEYDEGTLTIDFLDAESQKLFWRGTGIRRIAKSTRPQKSTEYTQKWVAEILKQYPPGVKKAQPAHSGCSSPPRQPSSAPPLT